MKARTKEEALWIATCIKLSEYALSLSADAKRLQLMGSPGAVRASGAEIDVINDHLQVTAGTVGTLEGLLARRRRGDKS